jgi:hypothetical protein
LIFSVTTILKYLNFNDQNLIDYYLLERKEEYLRVERSLFVRMSENCDKRREIHHFIHLLVKSNKIMLTELFDDQTHTNLIEDLDNFEVEKLI